jgi:hypothetical protein
MLDDSHANESIVATAARLATLLTDGGGGLRDSRGGDLLFEDSLQIRPLTRTDAPREVWAVDGGQALVADARCLQVYVTRASRARWVDGCTALEDEGELRAHLLGLGQDRQTLAALGAPVDPDSPVDVNLLRDWAEWETAARCIHDAERGALVLLDGDLQPDWRIPSSWLAGVLAGASARAVTLAGVTKHSGLSWGGAPLLGLLERRAPAEVGERGCWWVPVARTRPDVSPGIQVLVARLDPDSRFSFRVDLPADAEPVTVLGALADLSDDAAFPGYPYPLSVADRLAACPRWVRDEAWDLIDDVFDSKQVPLEVRERAFADRHRMMERY